MKNKRDKKHNEYSGPQLIVKRRKTVLSQYQNKILNNIANKIFGINMSRPSSSQVCSGGSYKQNYANSIATILDYIDQGGLISDLPFPPASIDALERKVNDFEGIILQKQDGFGAKDIKDLFLILYIFFSIYKAEVNLEEQIENAKKSKASNLQDLQQMMTAYKKTLKARIQVGGQKNIAAMIPIAIFLLKLYAYFTYLDICSEIGTILCSAEYEEKDYNQDITIYNMASETNKTVLEWSDKDINDPKNESKSIYLDYEAIFLSYSTRKKVTSNIIEMSKIILETKSIKFNSLKDFIKDNIKDINNILSDINNHFTNKINKSSNLSQYQTAFDDFMRDVEKEINNFNADEFQDYLESIIGSAIKELFESDDSLQNSIFSYIEEMLKSTLNIRKVLKFDITNKTQIVAGGKIRVIGEFTT